MSEGVVDSFRLTSQYQSHVACFVFLDGGLVAELEYH